MLRLRLHNIWLLAAALLALLGLSNLPGGVTSLTGSASAQDPQQAVSPAFVPAETPPPQKTVSEVLGSGVVITVSLQSQTMHVFRDGVLWRSTPVSTGKRGKRTPTGTFAILQKKRFHRSNLYSNAPMPFMQRLTWSGIAIHAGKLPGYPASHGCIRVPSEFAQELFAITNQVNTAVVIVSEPLADGQAALALAQSNTTVVPIAPALLRRESPALAAAAATPVTPATPPAPAPRIPAARTIPTAAPAGGQTIQLAATLSPDEARAHWASLAAQRPELRDMQVAVVSAVVKGTQYYRLRASAPDAHARCAALQRKGVACFAVR